MLVVIFMILCTPRFYWCYELIEHNMICLFQTLLFKNF